MATFLVKLTHTSDQGPVANSKVRERVLSSTGEIPVLAGKLGVKMVAGPLVVAEYPADIDPNPAPGFP